MRFEFDADPESFETFVKQMGSCLSCSRKQGEVRKRRKHTLVEDSKKEGNDMKQTKIIYETYDGNFCIKDADELVSETCRVKGLICSGKNKNYLYPVDMSKEIIAYFKQSIANELPWEIRML
jgi:hypothetical protein